MLPAPTDAVGDARRVVADPLVEEARATGVGLVGPLVGPGGPLADLTMQVFETGSEVEMSQHLGYEKHSTARMRRATRARGHFPNEQAAMKCLYLVVRSLDPTGKGASRWMNRWKPALNAFAVTFDSRLFPIDQ